MAIDRFIRDLKLGLKTLLQHKLRSMLTMLGVVFGVGSVIAMLAVGEGASKDALDQIKALGSTNIIIRSERPLEETQATQRIYLNIFGLKYDDELRIRETYEDVKTVVPVKSIRKEARVGTKSMEMRLVGTTADWFRIFERPLLAGRPLRDGDMNSRRGVCVLTEFGARRLLASENTIGESVRIGSHYFEVVGIIRNESAVSGGVQAPDQAVDAYIPIGTMRERFGDYEVRRGSGTFERNLTELSEIIVEVESDDKVEITAIGIQSMLEQFHPRQDYSMQVPLQLLRQAERTKRTFNIVLGSIAGISLLVGGIGIMNIMLASVTERTKEIGIRRAIGAKRKQIIIQFLIETVTLSMIGGLIGIVFGVTVPLLIEHFAGMPTLIPIYGIVLSLFISVGVGVVFGLYPAIRAASLDPIVALRHE